MIDRSRAAVPRGALPMAVTFLLTLLLAQAGFAQPENDANAAPPPESAPLGMPKESFDAAGGDSEGADDKQRALAKLDPRNNQVMQVIGAMALVLGLLLLTKYLFARAGGPFANAGRPSGVIEILARYPVARGQQLMLIKIARRVLLVHQSGTAMTTLSEMADEREVASLLGRIEAGTAKKDAGFKTIFKRFASEYDQTPDEPAAYSGSSDSQGEVIDLTRRPGGLRTMFSRQGSGR